MSELSGQVLGRYRVAGRIGRGGMADVYRARDEQLGRSVAIKVILPQHSEDAEYRGRFVREARLVAGLEHPHVLPIYDVGEHRGQPYLVMPLLEGGSLERRLKAERLTVTDALEVLTQIASGLDAAHAAGVLHRDVKPANVLLNSAGRVVLGDFGIAKSATGGMTQLTQTGLVVGTPAYMAPELAKGEAASEASDRYAFACIAYELLAGRPPFAGDNVLSMLHQHATQPVPSILTLRSDLPPVLDAVFERALAKSPNERPLACGEIVTQLAAALGSSGLGAPAIAGSDRILHSREVEDASVTSQRTLSSDPRVSDAPAGAPSDPKVSVASPVPSSPTAATVLVASSPSGRVGRARRLVATSVGIVALVAVGWVLGGRERAMDSAPGNDSATSTGQSEDGSFTASPEPSRAEQPETEQATLEPEPRGTESTVPAGLPLDVDAGSEEETSAPAPELTGLSATSPPGGRSDTERSPPFDLPARSGPPGRFPTGRTQPPGATGPRAAGTPLERIHDSRAFRALMAIEDRWRQGRLDRATFERLVREAAQTQPRRGRNGLAALRLFGEGGLAYVDGDDALARSRVDDLLRERGPSGELMTALPVQVLERGQPLEDWQLALVYGDPLDKASDLVAAARRDKGETPMLLMGAAMVAHFDGDRELAIDAGTRSHQALTSSHSARPYVARFVAEQLVLHGELGKAVSWIERTGVAGPLAGASLVRLVQKEHGLSGVEQLCDAGVQVACNGPPSRR